MPITENLSPVEIDTFLAANWEAQAKAEQRLVWAKEHIRSTAGQKQDHWTRGNPWNGTFEEAVTKLRHRADTDTTYVGNEARKSLDRYDEAYAALDALFNEAEPYEDEYNRRPWNRYFLVKNTNGHVHRNRNCSTCFATTQYGWCVELADADEAALVAEYGELACTVCFPDAPVHKGYADGTSAFAQIIAAEREAKAAEKQARLDKKNAKNLTTPVRVPTSSWKIETVYAAKQEIKRVIDNRAWYNEAADSNQETIDLLTVALEAKGIDVAPLIVKWTKAAGK